MLALLHTSRSAAPSLQPPPCNLPVDLLGRAPADILGRVGRPQLGLRCTQGPGTAIEGSRSERPLSIAADVLEVLSLASSLVAKKNVLEKTRPGPES